MLFFLSAFWLLRWKVNGLGLVHSLWSCLCWLIWQLCLLHSCPELPVHFIFRCGMLIFKWHLSYPTVCFSGSVIQSSTQNAMVSKTQRLRLTDHRPCMQCSAHEATLVVFLPTCLTALKLCLVFLRQWRLPMVGWVKWMGALAEPQRPGDNSAAVFIVLVPWSSNCELCIASLLTKKPSPGVQSELVGHEVHTGKLKSIPWESKLENWKLHQRSHSRLKGGHFKSPGLQVIIWVLKKGLSCGHNR